MKKLLTGAALVVVLSACVLTWWFWPRENPQLAKIASLQKEIFAQRDNFDPQKGRQVFEQIGKEMEKLPEKDREKVMNDGMDFMQKMMNERFNKYFAATPAEQVKLLDEDIDRMNRMMMMGPPGGGRPPEGARPPGGGGPPGGPPPGGGSPWGRGGTPDERNARRRGMLDRTTPQFRAQMGAYFAAIMERRRERGLPEMPMPFGRR